MNIKMNKLHGSRSRRRQRRRAWIPGVVGLVTHHSGQLLLRGRVFPHFHDEGARARSLWAGTGLLAVWVQSSSASRGRLQSPSPVHREPTLLAVLPTKARLAQAEGLPSIGEMALPLVTLEGRAGVGVILVITRGPAVAFCTLAHVRGPSWHTFPAVAAVGRGQNEKGEGRALQRFSLSTTAKAQAQSGSCRSSPSYSLPSASSGAEQQHRPAGGSDRAMSDAGCGHEAGWLANSPLQVAGTCSEAAKRSLNVVIALAS